MNLQSVVNTARRLSTMFPGFFGMSGKHNFYADFGFKQNLVFNDFYNAYTRNSLAKGGVTKLVGKVWQDMPVLIEDEKSDGDGSYEKEIFKHFQSLRLWQHLAEAEKRGLVGCYAGVILRIADGKKFEDPVDLSDAAGLEKLVEIIPAWEGQLTVGDWYENEEDERYGQPKSFQFNEAAVPNSSKQSRSFNVHPDRVIIWSTTGTVHDRSILEAGYNDLVTIEKIVGAGGEGFWKNAKSAPIITVDENARTKDIAEAMGVTEDKVQKAMSDQVDDFNKGFDKVLMLQGMKADGQSVDLPSPEHFFLTALNCFAASISIPAKILLGSQTGERASTEDAEEWSKTCNSYRETVTIPNIMALIERLVSFNILRDFDWSLEWADLTEASMKEKIERADKMSTINERAAKRNEVVFLSDEIRSAVDYKPLTDAQKYTSEYSGERDEEIEGEEEEE